MHEKSGTFIFKSIYYGYCTNFLKETKTIVPVYAYEYAYFCRLSARVTDLSYYNLIDFILFRNSDK